MKLSSLYYPCSLFYASREIYRPGEQTPALPESYPNCEFCYAEQPRSCGLFSYAPRFIFGYDGSGSVGNHEHQFILVPLPGCCGTPSKCQSSSPGTFMYLWEFQMARRVKPSALLLIRDPKSTRLSLKVDVTFILLIDHQHPF